jgi:hypothetical protein
MNDIALTSEIAAALAQIDSTLNAQAPFLSGQISEWIRQVSPNRDPFALFTHQRMFPLLQLPVWLADTLPVPPDEDFHRALIQSSINGYFYIRLIDDVVDGDQNRSLELSCLPAAGFFSSRFQFFYQRHFPPDHAFWSKFHELWLASCESAACDASLRTVSREDFERVSSRKYSAAGIPVAAVCHHYNCPELLAPWLQFTHDLARWSQMLDDTLDWHADRRDGRATYFLSEAERRKRDGESLERWIAREGHDWAFSLLEQWMRDLRAEAGRLGSAGLDAYLGRRQGWLQQQEASLRKGYRALLQLARILETTPALSASEDSGISEIAERAQKQICVERC